MRHNLRLCYSRLIAGGIVDLQSKFVLVPLLELTRAVAQTVPVLFLDYLLLVDCHVQFLFRFRRVQTGVSALYPRLCHPDLAGGISVRPCIVL